MAILMYIIGAQVKLGLRSLAVIYFYSLEYSDFRTNQGEMYSG